MTASSRVYLVLCRWNTLETVFVALGLRLQRRQCSAMRAMSAVKVHSNATNLSACRWLDRCIDDIYTGRAWRWMQLYCALEYCGTVLRCGLDPPVDVQLNNSMRLISGTLESNAIAYCFKPHWTTCFKAQSSSGQTSGQSKCLACMAHQ